MVDAPSRFPLVARELTPEAFAPFGQVVEHAGEERRTQFPDLLEANAVAWVSRVSEALAMPARISVMERHPHSRQLFAPLRGQPSLVVVCHSGPAGDPDLSTAQAFVAHPWQGVSYARNVWHHGLSVLSAPAQFLVSMAVGQADDDVFFELPQPFTVTLAAKSDEACDAV